jgi:hypothetical protein
MEDIFDGKPLHNGEKFSLERLLRLSMRLSKRTDPTMSNGVNGITYVTAAERCSLEAHPPDAKLYFLCNLRLASHSMSGIPQIRPSVFMNWSVYPDLRKSQYIVRIKENRILRT